MSTEYQSLIPREQLVSQALNKMRRAAMFQVVLKNVLEEVGMHYSNSAFFNTTAQLQALAGHSVFHSLLEINEYGDQRQRQEALEIARALELYHNEGFLNPLIFPKEGVSAELIRFGNEFALIDIKNSHHGVLTD